MAKSNQTERNHYVPQWYQRRFLPAGETHFHYLDLTPDTLTSAGGTKYTRRAINRWGPPSCFCLDNLYTLKLGTWSSDAVEHRFFGPIDARGKMAVEFFSDYAMKDGVHEAFEAIIPYMDAQRFRTPRGLDRLKLLTDVRNQNAALILLSRVYQYNATMWAEGVWEVVNATQSPTKFLLTDEPVTFFNSKAFPRSPDFAYPKDVELADAGTRTIFPLGLDRCLISTHLQLVRNPNMNPRKARANARSYSTTMRDLSRIQHGRELEEDEVLRINFILKRRATRYIAAVDKEWLYPERRVSTDHWSKLDDDWFLLPNPYKVPFTTGIFAGGYKDGSSFAMDEYGRRPGQQGYQDEALQRREMILHDKSKVAWALRREGKSIARVIEFRDNDIHDHFMRRDIAEHHARKSAERRRKGD